MPRYVDPPVMLYLQRANAALTAYDALLPSVLALLTPEVRAAMTALKAASVSVEMSTLRTFTPAPTDTVNLTRGRWIKVERWAEIAQMVLVTRAGTGGAFEADLRSRLQNTGWSGVVEPGPYLVNESEAAPEP